MGRAARALRARRFAVDGSRPSSTGRTWARGRGRPKIRAAGRSRICSPPAEATRLPRRPAVESCADFAAVRAIQRRGPISSTPPTSTCAFRKSPRADGPRCPAESSSPRLLRNCLRRQDSGPPAAVRAGSKEHSTGPEETASFSASKPVRAARDLVKRAPDSFREPSAAWRPPRSAPRNGSSSWLALRRIAPRSTIDCNLRGFTDTPAAERRTQSPRKPSSSSPNSHLELLACQGGRFRAPLRRQAAVVRLRRPTIPASHAGGAAASLTENSVQDLELRQPSTPLG